MEGRLLLSDKDVARLLSICRTQVHDLKKEGVLPLPVKLGGSTRWRMSEILEVINKLEVVA